MLLGFVVWPFFGSGVTIPDFHTCGIVLVLIDKLKRKVSCSFKIKRKSLYIREEINLHPDDLQVSIESIKSVTVSTEMFGYRVNLVSTAYKVCGSTPGGNFWSNR